ncbi:DUF2330 domain-containing protein [[Eubacterium] cellulosolvens]
MARQATLLATSIVLFSLLTPLVHADRCILPITDADVFGPGQKAIVAWNGEVERLILSTDLYASADTKALEILPLPSEPSVNAGSFESFQAVEQLMMKNLPRVLVSEKEPRGFEIVFHKRIGAHDITVVKATSIDELVSFILEYAQKVGVNQLSSLDEKARDILRDYSTRGFNYWVFDLVDLHSTTSSVEPIVYEFRSRSLYYPLKVSATEKGRAELTLYLITRAPIEEEDIPAKMRFARYEPSDQVIQFQLSSDDLSTIDSKLAELLWSADGPPAWFTAVKYQGELSDLDFDLELSALPTPCRSIEVVTEKTEYKIGENVRMAVRFTHLLPGCAEIQVVHFHRVLLEVRRSSGAELHSWQWETNGDISETVAWKPQETDNYVVTASSWWNGQKLEAEDHAAISVVRGGPPDIVLPGLQIGWLLYGVIIAVVCILTGAAVAYLLLRAKRASK